jgi:predicted nucleic acid-binding Zn ribbon protein
MSPGGPAWEPDEPPQEREEYGPRPVHRLRESLAEVAADLRLDDPATVGGVINGWAAAVGPAVAGHARPRTLREGILVVEVDSPEWATQLRYLEEDILRRLGRKVRPKAVTSIRVVVRRPSSARDGD